MKKLLIALLLCAGAAVSVFAQGSPPLRLQEIDGSPNVSGVTTIKVTNGTLSCSGKTCTITIAGGGGGTPGGSAGQVQWNDTGSFGGSSGITLTATVATITAPKIVTSILDTNGNELFLLTATGSAVNELTYANAATGANPRWTASGGDANVGFDFMVKGTGVYRLLASASGPTDLRLFEDSDNGSNYASIIAPASMAGDRVATLFDATDTFVGKATTDTFTNKTLAASSNVLGGVTMTLGSDADGDTYYRASGVLTRLAKGTAGQVLTMNGGATAPEWAAGGSVSGANPTASVGLAAVNGVATTYLRSDGAPALSQSIVPTWTGIHTFDNGVTTGTGATSGTVFSYNSLTTGVGANISSSSATSGSILNIASTSTAGLTGMEALNIAVSGANGTSAQTITGGRISVTNTNATSGTNVALELTASGATTANTALNVTAGQVLAGDASAALPAYASRTSNTTGIYFPGGNQIGFSLTGGDKWTMSGTDLYSNSSATIRDNNDTAQTTLTITSRSKGGFNANGGLIVITGGTAGSGGSGNNNGGSVTINGGVKTGSGADGDVVLASSRGNVLIGGSTSPTSAVGVLSLKSGIAPSANVADQFTLYAADAAAGAAEAWIRNEAGEITPVSGLAARNSSSFAKTTDTTLANITGLTRNVAASRTYAFRAVVQTTAAVTGGVKFAVSGTATATAISYEGTLISGAALVAQTRATALDTVVCASTTTTAGTCIVEGVISVSSAGTLTLQFAQNSSDAGASTVLANQYMQLIPIG